MKKLSIIIPYLNEGTFLNDTLNSIYETANPEILDIIAIDDGSTKKSNISSFKGVRNIINKSRLGVDGSRSMGIDMAESKYCLILDAHMRFRKDDWANKMIDYIDKFPKTLWCAVCLGLGYGTFDINNHKGKYYGAELKLFTPKEKDRPCRQIIEGVWTSEKPEDEYEISCLMGANYFFDKNWFNHIGGLRGLKSWGSSEPKMAICSYLSGGDCRLTKKIEIAHVFRDSAPYSTLIADLIRNKIRILSTIFPDDMKEKLMQHIPKDINYDNAMKSTVQDQAEIEKEKKYYQSIFIRDIYWLCNKFNIEVPK